MSDEQTLLLVLAIIYIADCLYWIPRAGLSVTNWLGRPWKLRAPSALLGNERGALGLANPLPPLGLATRCQGWPFAIMESGLLVHGSELLLWTQIKSVHREEKKIFINDQLFYQAATEYSARWLATEIARLQKLEAKQRAPEIAKVTSASCDPNQIIDRVERFRKVSAPLRWLGNALFVFLFLVAPYFVWSFGIVATLWPLVIGIYLQTLAIALIFSRAHRKIYPADSDQIFKPFLTMLLAAPSAIRAQDILGRPLLEPFHPLAVTKALCAPAAFTELAARTFRELNFPKPGSEADEPFRRALRQALCDRLEIREADFLKPPAPTESVHRQYCPRCLQQFTAAATHCPDCAGRALVSF